MTTLTKSYQLIDQTYLGTSGGNLYVRIYAKYSEQDITNNRSYVYYEARSYYENSTYIYDAQGSIGVSGTGADYQSASCTRPTTGESVSVTTSGWVYHNGDGTRTIDCAGSISFPNWGWSGTASGSASLPTIPRASEISSMSNVYIGEPTTINVNRKSSSFTHTITYSFGNLSGTVVTKSASTGVSWTIPESFYGQMTDTQQKNVTLYITTYNGNSQVGDRKSTTFTLRTRESVCKPDIDATIKDVNEDTLALTGDETIFVGGYSIAEVDYEATAKKDASIVAVKVNTDTAISNPYEYNVGANDTSIKVTAYDSRSYSSTKEFVAGTDYTFINYIQPTTNVTVKRKAPTSDEMLISFSGNYFNDTFGDVTNELTLSWKYREYKTYNPDNWTTGGTLVLGTDYVLKGNSYHSGDNADYEEEISLGHLFDYRKNYEIQFIYSDKLSNGSVVSLGIKGIPIVNWSDDFFNFNGDIRQYNNSIIDSGSNTNGSWIKYYDGTMICYKIVTGTTDISSQWGNMYTSSSIDLGNYPESFINVPTVVVTPQSQTGTQFMLTGNDGPGVGTIYAPAGVCIVRPAQRTNVKYILNVLAIGKWK